MLGLPQETLCSILESLRNQLYGLGRYVVEYKLFHWLVAQNCDKGLEPRSRQLLAEAVRALPADMPAEERDELRTFFSENTRAVRHWVTSFSKRWDVKPGNLGAGEVLEPTELQDKVANVRFATETAFCLSFMHFVGARTASDSGASFGPQISAPY